MSHRGEVGWSLWFCWVLANLAGAVTGWGLDIMYYNPINYLELDPWYLTSTTQLAGIVVSQWLVLRWWFFRSVRWVLATGLGFIIYAILAEISYGLSGLLLPFSGIAVIGVVLCLWQRQRLEQIVSHLIHRRRWGGTFLWGIVSAVGFVILPFAEIGLIMARNRVLDPADETPLFLWIITSIANGFAPIILFGMVTGTALLWLLRRPSPLATAP